MWTQTFCTRKGICCSKNATEKVCEGVKKLQQYGWYTTMFWKQIYLNTIPLFFGVTYSAHHKKAILHLFLSCRFSSPQKHKTQCTTLPFLYSWEWSLIFDMWLWSLPFCVLLWCRCAMKGVSIIVVEWKYYLFFWESVVKAYFFSAGTTILCKDIVLFSTGIYWW